jgi:hypothetical protein
MLLLKGVAMAAAHLGTLETLSSFSKHWFIFIPKQHSGSFFDDKQIAVSTGS